MPPFYKSAAPPGKWSHSQCTAPPFNKVSPALPKTSSTQAPPPSGTLAHAQTPYPPSSIEGHAWPEPPPLFPLPTLPRTCH
jgi:hypothetical protein